MKYSNDVSNNNNDNKSDNYLAASLVQISPYLSIWQ